MTITFHGKIVEFYPYRTARVPYEIREDFSASYEQSVWLIKQLKSYLERNGYDVDNHICWKTESGLYMQYSDHKLSIGTTILKGNW